MAVSAAAAPAAAPADAASPDAARAARPLVPLAALLATAVIALALLAPGGEDSASSSSVAAADPLARLALSRGAAAAPVPRSRRRRRGGDGGASPTPFAAPPGADEPPAAAPRGQLTASSPFGRALARLASQPDVELFLESGTFFGGGSTLCIARALRDSSRKGGGGRLVSIEAFPEPHAHAVRALRGLPVELLLGTAVAAGSFPSAAEVKRSGAVFDSSDRDWRAMLEAERAQAAKYEEPLLAALCAARDFDAVLIDGAEFSGPAEFEVVREACRPRYIALHDTNSFKCQGARANLTDDPEWAEWEASPRGDFPTWAIFERVTGDRR